MLVYTKQKVPLFATGSLEKSWSTIHNNFDGRLHFTVSQFNCSTSSQLECGDMRSHISP